MDSSGHCPGEPKVKPSEAWGLLSPALDNETCFLLEPGSGQPGASTGS